jgi:hypothetical protein
MFFTLVPISELTCNFDDSLSLQLVDLGCLLPSTFEEVRHNELHPRHYLRWCHLTKHSPYFLVSSQEIDRLNRVNQIVDELQTYFGSYYGYKRIDTNLETQKKHYWRLSRESLTDELLQRWNTFVPDILDDRLSKKIIEYNHICQNSNLEANNFGIRLKCTRWKFWLGYNFPEWLSLL